MQTVRKMNLLLLMLILLEYFTTVQCYGKKVRIVCEGSVLNIDCPLAQKIRMFSANFGRTNENLCALKNQSYDDVNCVSKKAKTIIYQKCEDKIFCVVRANSTVFGEDSCPGVIKYIDVIYECVSVHKTSRKPASVTPPLIKTTQLKTTLAKTTMKTRDNLTTFQPNEGRIVNVDVPIVNKPNETITAASSHKPNHSLLSVLIGVAAGSVVALATVLICVCVGKKRKSKKSSDIEGDHKNDGAIELEKSELLAREMKENNDNKMAKTDDQVDSAFCDDDLDGNLSNGYETTSDLAYLDAYLEEYNKNRSLPRPPVDCNSNSSTLRMSRGSYNDGMKGLGYDYIVKNHGSFSTFSHR